MTTLKIRYQLYPTPEQEQKLNQICGSQRAVWNHFLKLEKQYYALNHSFQRPTRNMSILTEMMRTPEWGWLQDTPITSMYLTLADLDSEILRAFSLDSENIVFPGEKVRKKFHGSFKLSITDIKRNSNYGQFFIPKIGDVDCSISGVPPKDVHSYRITLANGRWIVSLNCGTPGPSTRKKKAKTNPTPRLTTPPQPPREVKVTWKRSKLSNS